MTITLTGSATPSQMWPINASSRKLGMKKPDGSCGGIGFRTVQSVVKRVCRVALLTQKQICPRIDKGVNALRSRSFTNGCDPPGVLVDWIEPGALNDAVFEIDPDDTEFKEAGHIFGQRTIVSLSPPFEVDGHRCIDRAYDARNDLLDECDRNG